MQHNPEIFPALALLENVNKPQLWRWTVIGDL